MSVTARSSSTGSKSGSSSPRVRPNSSTWIFSPAGPVTVAEYSPAITGRAWRCGGIQVRATFTRRTAAA